jgi:hypothetical protein
VAKLPNDVANSNVRASAEHVPGAIEAALPLTPERLELIKAYAENSPRRADGVTASRIAQRFAPRPPAVPHAEEPQPVAQARPAAPFSALASGIRRLTGVLIVVALLPNLTLAALWLGALEWPWSKPAVPASGPGSMPVQATAQQPLPVVSAPSALEARAGEHVSFPIALDGTDGVPPGSMVVIKGLPQGSRLSNGHRHGATQWTLQPDEIGDLHLVLPAFASRESKLAIELVAPGDRVVADASTTLRLIADREMAETAARHVESESAEPQIADTEAAELAMVQGPDAAETPHAVLEEATGSIDAPTSPEVVPLPTRRPEPPGSDDADASWIKPTAYVNLRNAPSSGAGVVGVVAKGAKLRVVSRKRGWVQVNDPATAKAGWIYSGNAAAAGR